MKKQVLPLFSLAVFLIAPPAFAGQCSLMRMYKDANLIMQHFSTQPLRAGDANSSACSAECRSEGAYMPETDRGALQGKRGLTNVSVSCDFQNDKGEKSTLAASTVAIGQLREKPHNSSQRTVSPNMQPLVQQVVQPTQRPAVVQSPTAPVVQQAPAPTPPSVPAPAPRTTFSRDLAPMRTPSSSYQSPSYDYQSPYEKPYVSPYVGTR